MTRGYLNSKTPDADRDEMRTPQWLFNWLNARFKFDIDLAASFRNTAVSRGCFDKAADGLTQDWWVKNSTGFCNPPYSNIKPWIAQAHKERSFGFTTCMVVPSINGESWGAFALEHATEIIDFDKRVNFLRPDGTEMKGNNRGTCIVIFEPHIHGQRRSWVQRDELIERYS